MPRRKRHSKLPNGYGNISYLGKGRRRPYAVYPPATLDQDGKAVRSKALGYCETYEEAREILALYHQGLSLPDVPLVPKSAPTFAEVYEKYYAEKYSNPAKPLSDSSRSNTRSAYLNVPQLHDREFASLTYADLQSALDACGKGIVTVKQVKTLLTQMCAYAEKYGITDRDASRHLEIRKADDIEHGVPFSDADIDKLWEYAAESTTAPPESLLRLLLMIYTGYRISAYKSLTVRLAPEWYLQGGVKTAAGKDRVVPIHHGIQPVAAYLYRHDALPKQSTMGREMRSLLPQVGIQEDHTPHDCRHTFSRLLEKYGAPENDRKRLLGHSFGDVTNAIYGHREINDLRQSVEMIRIPDTAKTVAKLLRTVT